MTGKSNQIILLGTISAIMILGVIVLASVSGPLSQEEFGTPYYFLRHQLLYGFLPGIILGFLAYRINLSSLKKSVPFLLLATLVLMGMVFLSPFGQTAQGASRWLDLGPISFQPAEFLKLAFILYLAVWLAARTDKGNRKNKISQTFFAFGIVVGVVSLLLIFQPDISTLAVISLTALIMYFLAQTPFWHSLLTIALGITGLALLIKFASYRFNRLLVFLNPDTDPMGIGYQIKHALIAIGSGGIGGLGLGMSNQKFGLLPQSMSDSLFAIFAEETGFVGALILLALFVVFLWVGFKIAKGKKDKFSQLCAFGITSWIILQGLINIGSIIGILPITGIPLPFISYGGSALIVELIGVGILLNIARKE